MTFSEQFHRRAAEALRIFTAQPLLAAAVKAEIDAFFARYPEIERTELAAAFIGSITLEKMLSPAADSQSAAQPEKQKAA